MEQAKEAARTAAEMWLSAIDAGDAKKSWAEASSLFRGAVSTEKWAESLETVQGSLGKAIERSFESAEYHTELPGAPDGHYVVLTFKTAFERKQNGTETVTPQLDVDGKWRVSGYFVK